MICKSFTKTRIQLLHFIQFQTNLIHKKSHDRVPTFRHDQCKIQGISKYSLM